MVWRLPSERLTWDFFANTSADGSTLANSVLCYANPKCQQFCDFVHLFASKPPDDLSHLGTGHGHYLVYLNLGGEGQAIVHTRVDLKPKERRFV